MNSLWKTHPQKYCLKMTCVLIYYLGGGYCWYSEKKMPKPVGMIYKIYAVTINAYALFGFINEMLAMCRPLTNKETNDVIQYLIGHGTIFAKLVVFYLQMNRIKALLERFLEDDRSQVKISIEKASAKRALTFVFSMVACMYMALLTATLDGIRIYAKQGIPIRTEVVYYPSPAHSGFFVNVLRVFVEFHWWYITAMLSAIDSLSVCFMVFLAAKFKLLVAYFEGIREKLVANQGKKSQAELDKMFIEEFIAGIKLHQNSLWYADRIQYALGNLYSVQVIQTMFLIIVLSIKLVFFQKNLMFLVASFTFIFSLVILLGGYMIPGGDVTYESSLVTNAIFSSGWELTSGSRSVRTLVVVTMIRSQRPVIMTSFGILDLSYANFISVLRCSYSFIAVFI